MTFKDKSRDYARDIAFSRRLPHDDALERNICDHCGLINYENPRIIAGVVAHYEDQILLCRRAIEPRAGFWTLPAGFMELNETVAVAAAREAQEEACADVEIDCLLGVYNVSRISQVQIFYRGRLRHADIACGVESIEVGLFHWQDIPWDALAFPSVYWALQHYHQTKDQAVFVPFSEPDDWSKTPGFEALARG
jgi:ADP-ribose pyrophosphatase YjhB (NUDIX family)